MTERDPSSWDARLYGETARYMTAFGEPLVEILAAQPGERVLDLGCGDGVLAERIAQSGADVIGVDSSPAMVEGAQRRGVDARVADAYSLSFEEEFDAVFSNSALHYLKRPEAAIAEVRRALKRGGRFVAELGAEGNIRAVERALRVSLGRRGIDHDELDPFYFPAGEEYRRRLLEGGFAVDSLEVFEHRTRLPGDVGGWLRNFGHSFFASLSPAERDRVIGEVIEATAPELRQSDGTWTIDHVRLRCVALKGESPS